MILVRHALMNNFIHIERSEVVQNNTNKNKTE